MPLRKKILIGFFLLLITSQLYGFAFAPTIPLKEQRKLAEIPAYKTERLLKRSYYVKFGRFLDERYPYRSLLIFAKNWVDYNIFKTAPTDQSPEQVHIGTDGWFYLKNGMNDYFKDDCEKRKAALALARKLNLIEKILESSGKRFFFVVAPDKATIYPEYIRIKRSLNNCGKSFYDLFVEALEEYPLHGFIRLDDRFLEAKKKSQLYFKKGTHWNYRGAALASKVLLERLSTPSKKVSLPDLRYKEGEVTRDLAAMFALPIKEKSDYAIKVHKNKTIKRQDLKALPNGNSHFKITAEADSANPLLPRAIIYRDSFMTIPLTMMDGSFAEIDALWTRSIPVAPETDFSSLKASKIVIIEVIERVLENVKIDEKALTRAINGKPSS